MCKIGQDQSRLVEEAQRVEPLQNARRRLRPRRSQVHALRFAAAVAIAVAGPAAAARPGRPGRNLWLAVADGDGQLGLGRVPRVCSYGREPQEGAKQHGRGGAGRQAGQKKRQAQPGEKATPGYR